MKFQFPYLSLILAVLTTLCPSEADAQFSATRRDLKHHLKINRIRIFYDTVGRHAVDPADKDKSKVPDQVEDIARQIWAAHVIFVKVLKFPDPLESERYKDASYIDVNLLNRETIGLNGVAYDGLQNFKRPIDKPGTKTICFDVATSIRADSNITPAHEFFHLIQNGATWFKTRWYTEGMARWAEHALQLGGVGRIRYEVRGPWPQPEANLTKLFNLSYDAEFYLWNPLALKDDPRGLIPPKSVSPMLKRLTYSNGNKVLNDFSLNGWEFMRDVLVELGKMDDVAYKALGYSKWSEENQKSKKNSRYIYQAVMNVARKRGRKVGPFNVDK